MAENASTVFNVHVPEFVDAIWAALRDPTLAVREKAVEALRACLRVIEKRETRWRVQWYDLPLCNLISQATKAVFITCIYLYITF